MLETRHQPLLSTRIFVMRLLHAFLFGVLAIVIALGIGMLGYHCFENMPWIDAFLNASMILSGMGPAEALHTTAGKLFAGFYALFSGLTFILIIGVMFTPIVHRLYHKFHLDSLEK
jgi:hypothetical protein